MTGEAGRERQFPEGVFDALGISSPKRIVLFLFCALAAAATARLPGADAFEPAARRALFILCFAGLLWITEVIPAFAVGILVIGLEIALLGEPGGVFAKTARDWERFVVVIGHPLIWLFFGGFVLAAGMSRTGVDRWIAARVLGRLGDRPAAVLAGVMAVTFTLSMFMSNTATAAMMIATVAPILARLERADRFGTGLLLGVAVAANLGGMGTLIGTPPNAIAVGVLSELPDGPRITFLQWMIVGLPPGLALLGGAWLLILRLYPPREPRLGPAGSHEPLPVPPWQTIVVTLTLLLTVALWMTTRWHGLPTAVVSFLPIVALTTTGVLGADEIRGLPYDVLFLIAGGLALGQVVTETGLSTWIVGGLPLGGLGTTAAALVLAYVTIAASNVMSNTAAASILVPIGVTAVSAGAEARVAVPLALAASAAMCLPISTPPNALVHATGRCATRDLLRAGLAMGAVVPVIAVLWSAFVLRLLGAG